MTHRVFWAIMVTAFALSGPRLVAAQQASMPIIAYFQAVQPSAESMAALRLGLADGGVIEGRDVQIETRSADGNYERLPELAADLVASKVSAIVVTTPMATLAAKAATTTIPIVFAMGGDPVAVGLVQSLNRPGGNITGITFFANQLDAKRLEILHRLVPHTTTIAALANPTNPNSATEVQDTEDAANSLGLSLVVLRASTHREVTDALDEAVRLNATAIHVIADRFLTEESERIGEFALSHGIASSFVNVSSVPSGGLMAYGTDIVDAERQAALYAARILKGEKPADMPIIQSSKFEFVLNLKTAKALGLTIDPNLARLADRVIE